MSFHNFRLQAVLLAGLSFSLPSFGSVDQALVSLLPAGTTAVFGVNAEEARSSAFGQFLLKDTRWQDSHMQKVMAATGFDPRRDLHSLVVAAGPKGQSQPGTGQFAVIARGAFDSAKIIQAALQHGSTLQSVGGTDVYVSPAEGGAPAQSGFAFLDTDLAAFGELQTLTKVIAAHTSSKQVNSDLSQLIEKASSANDVWFASLGNPTVINPTNNGNAPAQTAQVFQAITQSSGGMKFGSTILFTFDALARSDKDATSLGDVVRFLASAAQIKRDQDGTNSPLGPAIDNLNLVTNGNEVLVTTSLPEADLEQLAQMHAQAAATVHHRAGHATSSNPGR